MIHFTAEAWKDYLYWQNTDKSILRKVNDFDLIKQYYQIPRPAPCPSPLRRDKEFAQGVQWMERKTDIFLVPL
jgi:Txe/YoeB family toxin of Txe-Axe toxin-antitoxin module